MKRVKLLLFLLPAIILLFPLPRSVYSAYSDSEALEATKDSYANQAYPDKINGGYNHIIISNKFTTRLAYLQFEDIDLPEGAILDSATLKFYVYERHYADTAKLNVGPISGDWKEKKESPTDNPLTWNNKPTINQTQAVEAEISLTSDGWKEVAITSLARKWRDGSLENKGVFIYPYGFLYASPETEYAFTFKSKEAGENNPKLEVAYHFEEPTPTPSPSPSPSPTPGETPGPTPTEEPSPTPEESPSPTPETEEEKAGILGLSTGQAVIGGLILLSLIGAGIAFAAYSRRKPAKKPKKKKKEKPEEKPEPEPEEKKEEEEAVD